MVVFRYMPRAGYRSGEKRVDVWLSTAGHANLAWLAGEWECSLSDAVVRLLREEVVRRGDGDAGRGVGVGAASGGGGSGPVDGGGGEGDVGVGAGDGGVPLLSDAPERALLNLPSLMVGNVPAWAAEALGLEGSVARHPASGQSPARLTLIKGGVDVALPFDDGPIIGDEFIDVP